MIESRDQPRHSLRPAVTQRIDDIPRDSPVDTIVVAHSFQNPINAGAADFCERQHCFHFSAAPAIVLFQPFYGNLSRLPDRTQCADRCYFQIERFTRVENFQQERDGIFRRRAESLKCLRRIDFTNFIAL